MKSVHTDKKRRNGGGFTLVEVIVTLVILALTAAVIVPALTGWIGHSREKICQIHRREIIRWYRTELQLHYADGVAVTLADVLAGNVAETAPDVPTAKCPSGGAYTASGESIACSVHGGLPDEEGGGTTPAPNVLPGTSIPLVGSYWPSQEEYAANPYGSKTVAAGGIFRYSDGNYYVVTKTTSMTKGQAATGPGGDLLGWYSTEKITGRILIASDFNAWGGTTYTNTIARGDIFSDGAGHYYVFNTGGSVAALPSVNMSGWYLLP